MVLELVHMMNSKEQWLKAEAPPSLTDFWGVLYSDSRFQGSQSVLAGKTWQDEHAMKAQHVTVDQEPGNS